MCRECEEIARDQRIQRLVDMSTRVGELLDISMNNHLKTDDCLIEAALMMVKSGWWKKDVPPTASEVTDWMWFMPSDWAISCLVRYFCNTK